MARSSGFDAAATPAKNECHRSGRRVVRMSHMKKSNSRSPGARSERRKMAEPDESKMEQEQELSEGPREKSAATSGPAFEEPPAPNNNSPSPGDNHQRGVRTMDDKETASRALFEGFSDMTKTLFSP